VWRVIFLVILQKFILTKQKQKLKKTQTRLVAFSKHIYIRENCHNKAKIKENPNASLSPNLK